jgi:hypothetical protein
MKWKVAGGNYPNPELPFPASFAASLKAEMESNK